MENYIKYIFLIGLSSLCWSCQPKDLNQEYKNIYRLIDVMEDRFSYSPASLSDLYAENAMIITHNDTIQGIFDIETHWGQFKNPVGLKIKTDILTNDLDSVIVSVDWRKYFEQKTKRPDLYIYQSGRMIVEYESEDVIFKKIDTPFFWVWEKQKEGFYRMVLNLMQDR